MTIIPATMIPIELIDHIFTFADNSSLFQLCRCSRLFHALAFPRLTSQHMSHSKIRLWIEQPGLVGHKPMDFEWFNYDRERGKLVFTARKNSTAHQQQLTFNTDSSSSSEAPIIDGLTIVLSPSGMEDRRIHSVSYKKAVVMPTSLPIKQQQEMDYSVQYPGNSNNYEENKRTAYSCAWQLQYQVIQKEPSSCIIIPKTFECDLDLLDPNVLNARINELPLTNIKTYKNNNIPVVYPWKSATTCALTD
ncbi:hypothetical protein BDC45DRAFT_161145 [Circinella umbellata]|nr:hypothetical protein BDC45DRAFT_161145 [Circinella umbellata]